MKNLPLVLCYIIPFMVTSQLKYEAKETNIFEHRTNNIVYTLKDNKPITGVVYLMHKNGKSDIEVYFENGLENGSNKCWYDNGNLKWENYSVKGKSQGIQKSWYENGQQSFEGNYVLGVENGRVKEWYENGQVKSDSNYELGKRIGWQKYFSKDGEPIGLAFLNEGDGNLIIYFEDGSKSYEYFYKNGLKNGVCKGWYKNGNIKAEVEYSKGNINGYDKYYYENGKISWQNFYLGGNYISGKCWDESGVEYECVGF